MAQELIVTSPWRDHGSIPQPPPNRLGAVLRYFASGYRYAFPAGPVSKADQRRLAYSMLGHIAEASRYTTPETVDVAHAIRLAVTSAWFYSGMTIISNRLAATDARPVMKRRVGAELLTHPNHPFITLLDRPNSMMTWEFIMRYTVGWAELLGNAYIFIATPAPGVGQPDELWPLPANAVTPLPKTIRSSRLSGKPIIDYTYNIGGKDYTLPGENLIHIRFANPFDYWVGLSPLTALMDAVKLDRFQSKYLQGFFGRDNAIPTAIISLPQETNEIDFEIIKEQIRQQFGEGRRSAITRAGDLSVNTITQTLHEMQIVEARKFNREEVNHVIGVPDGLISGGLSGDSRLATEITFARNTTQPLLDLITSSMDSGLSPYYGEGFVISAPSIIPQERSLVIQEYTTYSLDRSINENRQDRNLPPLDLVGIMGEINAIRARAGLEEIRTPLDDVTIDLMLRIPVRLIPVVSSNTSAAASKTSLRPGQTNADGEEVAEPLALLTDSRTNGTEPGGSPAERADAAEQVPESTGQGQIRSPRRQSDSSTAETGAHFVQANAGRAWDVSALHLGQKAELNRWRKIALKEAKEGRDPASRIFETDALPTALVDLVARQLVGADAVRVALVFDTIVATVQEMVPA